MQDITQSAESRRRGLVAEVRSLAAATDALGRARLVEEIVSVVYDTVKFHSPEGHGLDGRSGPERTGLARVRDAATSHRDTLALSSTRDQNPAHAGTMKTLGEDRA